MLGAARTSRRLFSSGYAMTNRSQRGSVRTDITAYCHIELWTKLLTTSPSSRASSRGSMQEIEARAGPTPGYLDLINTNVDLDFWRSSRAEAKVGRLGRNQCKPTAPVCPLLCMSLSFSSPVLGPHASFSRFRSPRFRTRTSRGECLRHLGNSTTCPGVQTSLFTARGKRSRT